MSTAFTFIIKHNETAQEVPCQVSAALHTIGDLKRKIKYKFGIPPGNQHLIYRAKTLEDYPDDHLLSYFDLHVHDGDGYDRLIFVLGLSNDEYVHELNK